MSLEAHALPILPYQLARLVLKDQLHLHINLPPHSSRKLLVHSPLGSVKPVVDTSGIQLSYAALCCLSLLRLTLGLDLLRLFCSSGVLSVGDAVWADSVVHDHAIALRATNLSTVLTDDVIDEAHASFLDCGE